MQIKYFIAPNKACIVFVLLRVTVSASYLALFPVCLLQLLLRLFCFLPNKWWWWLYSA